MLTTSSHLVIATANSVPVEVNTEVVDNNTCWTTVQIPCETSPTTQTGLRRSISSEKFIGSKVIEDRYMDCYPWMFRNSINGKCECSSIPHHSVLCDAEMVFCDLLFSSADCVRTIYVLAKYLLFFYRSVIHNYPHVYATLTTTIQGRIQSVRHNRCLHATDS